MLLVAWEVEFTDEFGEWWQRLETSEQAAVDAYVRLLEEHGPNLDYPYTSQLDGKLRELRVQAKGCPLRVIYAFDPRRTAILLIGGSKKGKSGQQFYKTLLRTAKKIYAQHLDELKQEGEISDA